MSQPISIDDRARYERDGYIVLRNRFDADDLARLEAAIGHHLPANAYAPGKVYPEAAKYTLSEQCPADPALAYIAEHPKVVAPAEQLLGGSSHLTAYVVYIRTPGDGGSLMHNDYKRWRPVGSSMNWLFTIVPLTDFDQETGPLLVAPGSHQLHLVEDRGEKTLHRGAPEQPSEQQFVDAEVRRGDLLLMNMYTWHWAPPNRSGSDRVGIFNKYAAVDAPPATGYFQNTTKVREAFSPAGQRLVAMADDRPVTQTRLVYTRVAQGHDEVLMTRAPSGDTSRSSSWDFPGGPGWEEEAIPGWDVGSRLGALEQHVRDQLQFDLPWASYIGDYPVGPNHEQLCRLYGFTSRDAGDVTPVTGYERQWVALDALNDDTAPDYACRALERWQDPAIVRGKGLSQARSKVDQYAV